MQEEIQLGCKYLLPKLYVWSASDCKSLVIHAPQQQF